MRQRNRLTGLPVYLAKAVKKDFSNVDRVLKYARTEHIKGPTVVKLELSKKKRQKNPDWIL